MLIYAGIDEAGYGPMFGPLVVGRYVFAIDVPADDARVGVDLWQKLDTVVCRDRLSARRGRIAVNDSKKLHTPGRGVGGLETGVLTFAALCGRRPSDVGKWLADVAGQPQPELQNLPWYAESDDRPWAVLPAALTEGQIAVASSMLATAAKVEGVRGVDLAAAVVFEDKFNRMVAATRSKAAVNFTFVAGHLLAIWQKFAAHSPLVVVDRQSGRTRYRQLLADALPDAAITIVREDNTASEYLLESSPPNAPARAMTIRFEVDAEQRHMPVALASMISKYTRELMMARLQAWFGERLPDVKPTAGYARDAQRFWREVEPALPALAIDPQQLKRIS